MHSARPFEEVSLSVTGAQSFGQRFPGLRHTDEQVPSLSPWKNNQVSTYYTRSSHKLGVANHKQTALSSVQNLYFVAYGAEIHVFRPQFPTQALPTYPELVIDTQVSNAGSQIRGWHQINNLVSQMLGKDEILAVVRDDGDVEAYLTRHIYQAIVRRCQSGNKLGPIAVDVKPFFHRNVGDSTWGLAIHSEARMIAVSSNNLEITVFTFALLQQGIIDLDDEVTEEEQVYHSGSGITPPSDRKSNDSRVIRNGNTNIPCIAFCNTGHDPTGRWLASTDISGRTRSWDVHKLAQGGSVLTTVQSTNGYALPLGFEQTFDRVNAGWSVMFLHPQSFRKTSGLHQALGLRPGSEDFNKSLPVWDISSSVEEVRRTAARFKPSKPLEVIDGNFVDPVESRAHDNIQTRSSSSRQHSGHISRPDSTTIRPSHSHALDQVDSDDDSNTSDDDLTVTEDTMPGAGAAQDNDMHDNEDADGDEDEDEDEESDDDNDEDDDDDNYITRSYPPQIRFKGTDSLCGDLPSPIMHASVTTIYLFQPSENSSAQGHLPIITMSEPFKQRISFADRAIDDFERCNMHAQIPSLGVVVIASQKGRVAILSLTQLNLTSPESGAKRKNYGYRLDHILPLESQEAAGHRPRGSLHGIAVGPLQGTENEPDEMKRWRLIVMYSDHSLLSYEIGKARSGGLDLGTADVII